MKTTIEIFHDLLNKFKFRTPVSADVLKYMLTTRKTVLKATLKSSGQYGIVPGLAIGINVAARNFGLRLSMSQCRIILTAIVTGVTAISATVTYLTVNLSLQDIKNIIKPDIKSDAIKIKSGNNETIQNERITEQLAEDNEPVINDLADENVNIAVIKFKGADSGKSKIITETIITDLAKSGILHLTESTEIDKIFKEQELSESGIINNKDKIIKLGTMTGAQYIITGEYKAVNSKIIISARLIFLNTGKIVKSWSCEGDLSEIFFYSHQIAGSIHIDLTKKDIPGQELTAKFDKATGIKELENVKIYLGFNRTGTPPIYRSGDLLKIIFKITGIKDKKYFITILNIGTDGEVNLLFPNKLNLNSEVISGKEYSVPDDENKYQLEVYGSPGKNIIIGIVTETPMNWTELIKIDESLYPLLSTTPDAYLDRGVRLKTEESGINKWKIGKAYFITEK